MPAIDQFGEPVTAGRAYRFGRFVSQIFHPIVNGIASFVVVGLAAPGLTPSVGLLWALACILTIVTPPTLYFYLHLFRGAYSDDDVSRRSERTGLYLVAIASTLVGSALLYALGLPVVFLRMLIAAIGVTGIAMLINFWWKISVHSVSIATLATLTTIFFQRLGVVLWLSAVVVGWARVRTGNHTPLQVVAGWTIAVLGVLLAFWLRFQ